METKQVLKNLLAEAEKQGLNDWYVPIIIRRAFYAGLALDVPTDPLAGYSNLTAAIKAGDLIEWERLDKKKIQCVKPGVVTRYGTLKRDSRFLPDRFLGWWCQEVNGTYTSSFDESWNGDDGWTLWIEGEIPMRRKRRPVGGIHLLPWKIRVR